MESHIKQRVIGGVVLVVVLLLFLPVLFHKSQPTIGFDSTAQNDRPASANHLLNNASSAESVVQPIELTIPAHPQSTSGRTTAIVDVARKDMQQVSQRSTVVAAISVKDSAGKVAVTQAVPSSTALPQQQAKAQSSASPKKSQLAQAKTPATALTTKPVARKYTVESADVHQHSIPASITETKAWVIQLASFSQKGNAERLAQQLRSKGYTAYVKQSKTTKGAFLQRVFVGPDINYQHIQTVRNQLYTDFKLTGLILKYTY